MTPGGTTSVPIREAMRTALEHHGAGRLSTAEAIYRAVLAAEPAHAGATVNLALIALQQGRPKEALSALAEAVSREPDNAVHRMNYAIALAAAGEVGAARDTLRAASVRGLGGKSLADLLARVERLADAPRAALGEPIGDRVAEARREPDLSSLMQLYEQGRFEEVDRQARRLRDEFPGSAPLARLIGASLLALQRYGQAHEMLVAACAAGVADALVDRLLGIALRRLDRAVEARLAFERSLVLEPDAVETLLNASANELALHEHARARRYAERALALAPGAVAPMRVLADALSRQGQRAQAVELYRRAIAVDPLDADLRVNLGDALTRIGRPGEAVAELERALRLRPGEPQAHLNLGNALFTLGETAAAGEQLRRAGELAPQRAEAHTAYLFCLLHDDAATPGLCCDEHRRLGALIEAPRLQLRRPHHNDRDPERELRVGFVSADLRTHAAASVIEPLWRGLRGGAHRLIAYSNSAAQDETTARLRALADQWVQVELLDDAALAERIRQDRIDVLIDLSGHMTDNRLTVFAMKPAPVQVSMIGYPGSTGLTAVDYLLLMTARGSSAALDDGVVEQLVRLHGHVFQPERDAPPVGALPARAAGRLTFGSFNRPGKIGTRTIDLWSRVLLEVPRARLLVTTAGEVRTQQRLREGFAAAGVDPDRLEFRPKVPHARFLELFGEVDVALDSLPYGGATTTNTALWMGVPVLTLAGDTLQQDQSATVLAHAGLHDWIARTPEEFVARAVAAAADLEALEQLRDRLRPAVAARFDGAVEQVGRAMDTALRSMWQRWCAGLPPQRFSVGP